MTKFLVSEKNSVLIDVPVGKFYASKPEVAVPTPKQKGDMCWFYAMQFLRPLRWGKEYDPTAEPRKREAAISAHRKRMNKIEDDYFKMGLEKKARLELELASCKQVFADLNLDPLPYLNETIRNLKKYKIPFKQPTSINDILTHYEKAIILLAKETYHITNSHWHPNLPIEALIKSLKKEGVLYITGEFGTPAFKTDPIIGDSIRKQPIYYWPKDAIRDPFGKGETHTVVLIGAAINQKGENLVYFLDPNDSSESRKIYQMSYELLCANVRNISTPKIDRNKELQSVFPYALCAEPERKRKSADSEPSSPQKKLKR